MNYSLIAFAMIATLAGSLQAQATIPVLQCPPDGGACEVSTEPKAEQPKAFAPSSVPTPKNCVQLKVTKLPGEHDLAKAMQKAKDAKKFLFIQYGRENCTLCQRTWNMLGTGAVKLPANFIYADVSCDDEETQITFEENFQIDDGGYYYPFIVIVGPDGRQLKSCSGAQLPETFQKMIEQAIADFAVEAP